MKISQPSDNPVVLSSNVAATAPKNGAVAGAIAKPAASKSTQTAGVAVTVSSMARSLEASNTPDVDTAKVSAVRASIANGTFVVNAEAIADKMLSNAQEMLTRNRG